MRVLFIGTGEIGVPTVRTLQHASAHQLVAIVTQTDKPAGRAQTLKPPAIKSALADANIPILQPPLIKDTAAIEQIREHSPDVIVVMAYGQILPRAVLEIPAVACLNLHASLLPRWRGAAPIQAAIAAGDEETGLTVMYMNEGLDTGDILLQRKIDISPGETGGSLHDRLGHIGPEALLESLRMLSDGTAPRLPQDDASATYAPKLDRNAGKIDWAEPAEVIQRKIRAFNPWPGAFTTITSNSDKPRNLKIFFAVVVDLSGPPGKIIYANERGLVIAAGRQALALQEIQLEGKQRMSAPEFLRGNRGLAIQL